MIPRHQKFFFAALLVSCAVMALYLIYLRAHAVHQLHEVAADVPMLAPADSPEHDVTLMMANDSEASIARATKTMALPSSPNGQARALLTALVTEYAKPLSLHPLPGGSVPVEDVFFLPLKRPVSDLEDAGMSKEPPPVMAIVNLTGAFAGAHPSGIEAEMLTVRSMVATLHENLPQVKQVRFLVDGRERQTLAGHASLQRVYDARVETGTQAAGDIE